jgi:hypothetical protein
MGVFDLVLDTCRHHSTRKVHVGEEGDDASSEYDKSISGRNGDGCKRHDGSDEGSNAKNAKDIR